MVEILTQVVFCFFLSYARFYEREGGRERIHTFSKPNFKHGVSARKSFFGQNIRFDSIRENKKKKEGKKLTTTIMGI